MHCPGVQRCSWASWEGTESAPSPCPLPQERETAARLGGFEPSTRQDSIFTRLLWGCDPSARRQNSSATRKQGAGDRRQPSHRATSRIIFFSKNEDFRPNAGLLYRLVADYASEDCRKGTPFADSIGGTDPFPFTAKRWIGSRLDNSIEISWGRRSFELQLLCIAGAVACMTESEPGVESERVSHNAPG